eukprot:291335-Chlamydomonas_euryale.AAC.1
MQLRHPPTHAIRRTMHPATEQHLACNSGAPCMQYTSNMHAKEGQHACTVRASYMQSRSTMHAKEGQHACKVGSACMHADAA